ncbi:MAG: DNA polymerase III subunit gamma/tau [Planctomycetia bacterium]|nr:DNA polymerase III subunit gamma/tau [Planctomycetia bacterium]
MSDTKSPAASGDDTNYVVVARRYRPQTFTELLGQDHVAKALGGAIHTNRVGHAYLFTGARGVGKTSTARILAKCLNCVQGPTTAPCGECDICQGVSQGSDVDVLEIDGASNRGIDEIRELRQNVNVRPSRARYKIYIIDEVHMLTTQAFNALLKTLEEPPEHVKFIFCTTEADKIPITILSRCQRFDFAGIETRSIADRLAQIAAAEGVQADADALAVLARRANGSMRDSQSLLEQLLSFGGERITVEDVQRLLGTVGDERIEALVDAILVHDAATALGELDRAFTLGVDPGLLMDQLLGYLRDLLVAAAGCGPESFRFTSNAQQQQAVQTGRRLGVDTVLALIQVVDQTLSRMRFSTYGRTLAELAVVRLSRMENLVALSDLLGALRAGGDVQVSLPPAAASATQPDLKKKASESAVAAAVTALPEVTDVPVQPLAELTEATAESVLRSALARVTDSLGVAAGFADCVRLVAPNRLALVFSAQYDSYADLCRKPDKLARLEKALYDATGRIVKVDIEVTGNGAAAERANMPVEARPAVKRNRLKEVSEQPFVRRAMELFEAEPVNVDDSQVAPPE